jgi:hypothetical protein
MRVVDEDDDKENLPPMEQDDQLNAAEVAEARALADALGKAIQNAGTSKKPQEVLRAVDGNASPPPPPPPKVVYPPPTYAKVAQRQPSSKQPPKDSKKRGSGKLTTLSSKASRPEDKAKP